MRVRAVARAAALGRRVSVGVALLVSACSPEGSEDHAPGVAYFQEPSTGGVTIGPVPPPGLFGDLPEDERAAALEALANGTPIEELPAPVAAALRDAEARDSLRRSARSTVLGIATRRLQTERKGDLQ
jgi:hypothetical protein